MKVLFLLFLAFLINGCSAYKEIRGVYKDTKRIHKFIRDTEKIKKRGLWCELFKPRFGKYSIVLICKF